MNERGHQDLFLTVDDPELRAQLLVILNKLKQDGEKIADGIGRTVVKNLKTMPAWACTSRRRCSAVIRTFPCAAEPTLGKSTCRR